MQEKVRIEIKNKDVRPDVHLEIVAGDNQGVGISIRIVKTYDYFEAIEAQYDLNYTETKELKEALDWLSTK